MLFRGSRYEHLPYAEMEIGGRQVRYLRQRFIPGGGSALGYTVPEGERPDLAAYRTLGDPEQFWRLCDVNRVMRPVDLTDTPGARIQVPGPQPPVG